MIFQLTLSWWKLLIEISVSLFIDKLHQLCNNRSEVQKMVVRETFKKKKKQKVWKESTLSFYSFFKASLRYKVSPKKYCISLLLQQS